MSDITDALQLMKQAIAGNTRKMFNFGVVTSASPFNVQWNGEAATDAIYPRMDSYTPVLNDNVIAAWAGNEWLVLGSVNKNK